MELITDGKINTGVALSIVWKLLIAAVLWYFNGEIKKDEAFKAKVEEDVQAVHDSVLVLKERTNQQRKELDNLNLRYDDIRDIAIRSEVVPRRRDE